MDCLVRSHGSRHGMVGSKSIPQPRGLRCRFALSPDQHADIWLGGWWTLPPVSKSPSHSFGNQYVRLMQHNRSLIVGQSAQTLAASTFQAAGRRMVVPKAFRDPKIGEELARQERSKRAGTGGQK